MKVAFVALFFLSILFAPWWLTVPLGIIILLEPWGMPVAVFGGVLVDVLFGTPIASLGGFAYLYTLLFVCGGLTVLYLRSRVVD